MNWLRAAVLPAAVPPILALASIDLGGPWPYPVFFAVFLVPQAVAILAWPPGQWAERNWFFVLLGSLVLAVLVSISFGVAGLAFEARRSGPHGVPGVLSGMATIVAVFPSCLLALIVPRIVFRFRRGTTAAHRRGAEPEPWVRNAAWIALALPFVFALGWLVSVAVSR